MFLWLFGIFLFFVDSGQAGVLERGYVGTYFNVTPEILHKYARPWQYYHPLESKFRYECTHIGRYPDPYDCRSYYTCDKIADLTKELTKPKHCRHDNVHFNEQIGCIIASEWCTCPPGTFWAGPSAGCINDSKEMQACCNFEPDCVNGDGGDFGECSLSTLGYKYSCRHDRANKENRAIISVEKCQIHRGSRDTCSPENPLKLTDLDLETYKVLPVCKTVKYDFLTGKKKMYVNETESLTQLIMIEYLDENLCNDCAFSVH